MSPTPTTAPPAWLETAAKIDALTADRVPLGPTRPVAAPKNEAEVPAPEAKPRPRLSEAPVVVPEMPQETRDEIDLAWRGYDAGALLPSTLVLSLLTAWVLLDLRRLVPATIVMEAIDTPLAALWVGQLIRAAYRLLAYRYRLTSRRLFRERGRLYPFEEPLDLATVAHVAVNQPLFDRLLGVGTVCIRPEDASGRPAVELPGVRRPRVLATAIEQAAQAARERTVLAARVELGVDERR